MNAATMTTKATPSTPKAPHGPRVERLALIGPYPVGRAPVGGVESVHRALAELLCEQQPDLRVSVLAHGNGEREARPDGRVQAVAGMPVTYRFARLRGFPREREAIEAFVASLEPGTVVHSTGPISGHVVRAAKRHGLPVVLTIHGVLERDVLFETQIGPLQRRVAALQLRRGFGWALRAADAVIAISSYSANYAREVGRRGPVTVIPNPLDRRFEGREHRHRPDGADLFFAANLQPRKGVHTLIEAFALAHAALPQLTLTLAGPTVDAAYADGLKARVRELGLESRVTWLGQVPKERVLERMMVSDLLLLASGEENLPQILQESGTVGLPFVSTDVGGIRDLVPRGLESQMLVAHGDVRGLADRIEALMGDPARRALVAERLREHMREHFSNAVILKRHLDVYSSVLGGSKR